MNLKIQKYDSIIEKINLYICLSLVFFMPLYKKVVPPLILFLILTWLVIRLMRIKNKFHPSTRKIKNKGIFFLLIFFYLIHIIGLIWTEDVSAGKFDLEVKLSLLIFPVLFIATNDLYTKNKDKILISFIVGNFIAVIICIINAFYNSVDVIDGKLYFNAAVIHKDCSFFYSLRQDDNYFFYEYFSVFHHPSYFSLYLIFSIVCLFYFLEKNTFRMQWIKFFCYFLIIFFSFIIFLLSSRANIILLFIVFIVKILTLRFWQRKKWIFIIPLVFIILIGAIFIKYNPRFDNFFTSIKQVSSLTDLSTIAGGNPVRIFLWKIGIEIIQENLLLGVGTGDIHKELNKKFDFYNFIFAKAQNYNVHNQFLETFITLGIFVFSTLLLIFIIPLIHAIKEKNFLLLFFLIIVGFNFLFESMLNTQAGVVFFAFFYCFLSFRFIVIRNN